MEKDQITEGLIKEKAKILFFQKGLLDATTQEIADEAGVNRTLIHYYFRSRELLMDTILEETVSAKRNKVKAIFASSLTFREKIATYIDTIVDHGMTYPYLENFIISETARFPDRLRYLCGPNRTKSSDLIREGLRDEIAHGKLAAVEPEHFLVNLSSMCNYPLLAKSVLKYVYGMGDTAYGKFLLERKQVIYRAIFNEEMPAVKPYSELKSITA